MRERDGAAPPDLGVTRLLEQIRTSVENTFRDILGSVPDAMVIVDERGCIAFANELAEGLFGYGRDELIGSTIEALVPERLRARHAEHRTGYFQDPRARPMGLGLELYGRRKDGTEFPVEISLSPLKTGNGILAVSAIRDVSERKAAEERAQLLIREQAARAALEDAVRLRDEFISIAAHELKTPLTGLRGFVELLLAETGATVPAPERLVRGLSRIDEQSRKLSRLVEELLDVSRIQTGRLQIQPEAIDLVPLIRGAAADARRAVEVRAPDAIAATADPLRIEQVLTDLIENAIAYSTPDAPIRVEAACSDGQVRIAVVDAGPGIPPEHRERVFEPFYRVDPAGSASGMGLGLHVSRRIVEQHGGSLRAEFPASGGTHMVVTLPAAEAGEAGRARAS